MAKSVSSPWIENSLLELVYVDHATAEIDDDASQNSKMSKTRKFHNAPKVVQVLICHPQLRLLEVSDGKHAIHIFYSSACEEIIDNVGASNLKYSFIKIKNYHFTTTVIASGDRQPKEILQFGKLSYPFAIQCKDLQYIGGHDLEKIGNPVHVNSSPSISKIPSSYSMNVKRLAQRQFHSNYLPQADGEEGVGDEPFSDTACPLTAEHLFFEDGISEFSDFSPEELLSKDICLISGDAHHFQHANIASAYLTSLQHFRDHGNFSTMKSTSAASTTQCSSAVQRPLASIAETQHEGEEENDAIYSSQIPFMPQTLQETQFTQIPLNATQTSTLLPETLRPEDESDEEVDLLGGKTILLVNSGNDHTLQSNESQSLIVPRETLQPTQLSSAISSSASPHKLTGESISSIALAQPSTTSSQKSPASSSTVDNTSSTHPAGLLLSYEDIASQWANELTVSCTQLEEKMLCFMSPPVTQVGKNISIYTQQSQDTFGAEQPIETVVPPLSATGDVRSTDASNKSNNHETQPPSDTVVATTGVTPLPLTATGDTLLQQVRLHGGQDFIGQKIAKYSEGLEFKEIRGIVRDFHLSDNTFVIEFETGEVQLNVPVDIASYNFVMDDEATRKVGSADWSQPFPPPAWPAKTAKHLYVSPHSSQTKSTRDTNDAAETVVVPFVLTPAVSSNATAPAAAATSQAQDETVTAPVTSSSTSTQKPKLSKATRGAKYQILPLVREETTSDDEVEDAEDESELALTQAQVAYTEEEPSHKKTQNPEAALGRLVLVAKPTQSPKKQSKGTQEPPSADTVTLKRQMDTLLQTYDSERNAQALEENKELLLSEDDDDDNKDGDRRPNKKRRGSLARFFQPVKPSETVNKIVRRDVTEKVKPPSSSVTGGLLQRIFLNDVHHNNNNSSSSSNSSSSNVISDDKGTNANTNEPTSATGRPQHSASQDLLRRLLASSAASTDKKHTKPTASLHANQTSKLKSPAKSERQSAMRYYASRIHRQGHVDPANASDEDTPSAVDTHATSSSGIKTHDTVVQGRSKSAKPVNDTRVAANTRSSGSNSSVSTTEQLPVHRKRLLRSDENSHSQVNTIQAAEEVTDGFTQPSKRTREETDQHRPVTRSSAASSATSRMKKMHKHKSGKTYHKNNRTVLSMIMRNANLLGKPPKQRK